MICFLERKKRGWRPLKKIAYSSFFKIFLVLLPKLFKERLRKVSFHNVNIFKLAKVAGVIIIMIVVEVSNLFNARLQERLGTGQAGAVGHINLRPICRYSKFWTLEDSIHFSMDCPDTVTVFHIAPLIYTMYFPWNRTIIASSNDPVVPDQHRSYHQSLASWS